MELKFHHVGVATSNIEKAVDRYESLGYVLQPNKIIQDPIQNVRIAFMFKTDSPLIELIAPLDGPSPVDKILQKNGSTPYHTCYEIARIEDFEPHARKNRFVQIIKPVPAIAFDGRRICFYFNREIGIIELLENEIPDI